MLKKFGIVTGVVTAGMLAAAPLASASTSFGDVDGDFNNQCFSEAGDVDADQTVDAQSGLAAIPVTAGPIASGSNVNVLNCTNILNDILNDNNVSVAVLGDALSGVTD